MLGRSIKSLFLALLAGALFASVPALAQTKEESIEFLRRVQSEQTNQIRSLTTRLLEQLNKPKNQGLYDQSENDPEIFSRTEKNIEALENERAEYKLRQDFVDRLLHAYESQYKGEDQRTFVSQQLSKMVYSEFVSEKPNPAMRRFVNQLRLVINEGLEQSKNTLPFVMAYTKYSTISNPKDPKGFLDQLNYSNGNEHTSARPMDRDQVGDVLESRIKISDGI
jgi:hypothetical protein